MIERFLKESKQAQLLLTTHYDGLLGEEDLLRKIISGSPRRTQMEPVYYIL